MGKLGYYVDGMCDGISCAMLMFLCMYWFYRHPPRQSAHALQLPTAICGKVTSHSGQ